MQYREGNWIDPKYPMQITSTFSDGVYANFEGNEGDVWEYKLKDIEPILMTEEWHNKFGVLKNGFNNFEYKLPMNNTIVFNGDYVFLRQGNDKPMECDIVTIWNKDLTKRDMYVHEFQNLYLILAGEELLNQSTRAKNN